VALSFFGDLSPIRLHSDPPFLGSLVCCETQRFDHPLVIFDAVPSGSGAPRS
jgi:hypothetical protein